MVDVLVHKTIKAADNFEAKTVMLAGGVAANKRLRERLVGDVATKLEITNIIIPDLKYTTDNAAMIAAAGVFKYKKKEFILWKDLSADCNYDFT